MSAIEQPLVLVVEDEASYAEVLEIGLPREGFRVAVARDGMEALDRFDALQPDLVLLDLMLPRLGGIDVCRRIRERSQVPIIMVTARAEETDRVRGLDEALGDGRVVADAEVEAP